MLRLRPLLVIAGLVCAAAATAETGEINDGALRLLAELPDPPPHHHAKQIRIVPDSLESGWVLDRQCHTRLDPVPALDIVFGVGRVRRLRVTQHENIGAVRVTERTVELQEVGRNATLCLKSELRAIAHDRLSGHLVLTSGPYMRRFLDGYFPMQLSLDISYPPDRLRFIGLHPPELYRQTRLLPGRVTIEALFEGRLEIEVRFEPLRDS